MKNPSQEGWLYFLVEKWRFLSAIIASLLMDLAFLLLWSLALFWYDKAVDYIDPTGAHSLIHIVKAIFELSTLAVVVVFLLADYWLLSYSCRKHRRAACLQLMRLARLWSP